MDSCLCNGSKVESRVEAHCADGQVREADRAALAAMGAVAANVCPTKPRAQLSKAVGVGGTLGWGAMVAQPVMAAVVTMAAATVAVARMAEKALATKGKEEARMAVGMVAQMVAARMGDAWAMAMTEGTAATAAKKVEVTLEVGRSAERAAALAVGEVRSLAEREAARVEGVEGVTTEVAEVVEVEGVAGKAEVMVEVMVEVGKVAVETWAEWLGTVMGPGQGPTAVGVGGEEVEMAGGLAAAMLGMGAVRAGLVVARALAPNLEARSEVPEALEDGEVMVASRVAAVALVVGARLAMVEGMMAVAWKVVLRAKEELVGHRAKESMAVGWVAEVAEVEAVVEGSVAEMEVAAAAVALVAEGIRSGICCPNHPAPPQSRGQASSLARSEPMKLVHWGTSTENAQCSVGRRTWDRRVDTVEVVAVVEEAAEGRGAKVDVWDRAGVVDILQGVAEGGAATEGKICPILEAMSARVAWVATVAGMVVGVGAHSEARAKVQAVGSSAAASGGVAATAVAAQVVMVVVTVVGKAVVMVVVRMVDLEVVGKVEALEMGGA